MPLDSARRFPMISFGVWKLISFMRIVAVLLIALTGCATKLNTRSGGPEVTIHGATLETIKYSFCNQLADRGFNIKNDTGSAVIAEKDGDASDNILFGSPAHPNTQKRIVLNFLELDGATRVLYHGFNVSHSFGELELKGDWHHVQWTMECIAAEFENRPHPPEPPKPTGPRVAADRSK
jgi:hypothetical protein